MTRPSTDKPAPSESVASTPALAWPDPLAWIDEQLADWQARGLGRHRTLRTGPVVPTARIDGRELVNFGSNDYLGLAGDERLVAALSAAAQTAGCGAAASPLLAGYTSWHAALEERLARFEVAPAALLFGSGFAANLASIPALVGAGDVIYSDQYNHASLIDGCRLSRARVEIYPHGDVESLAGLLRQPVIGRRLIVTDSVFSMHGDCAPLVELVELAELHQAMLLVDEAHATGLFGPEGSGLAAELGVSQRIGVRIGTLSKALGCVGGFVVGSASLAEWLVNRARSYVFSTALPPPLAAAACVAVDIAQQEAFRRAALHDQAAWLRAALTAAGWDIGQSTTQIIPLQVGRAADALALAQKLRDAGFYVPPIRPPSVPEGQARLRLAVSYAHTRPMLEDLLAALNAAA